MHYEFALRFEQLCRPPGKCIVRPGPSVPNFLCNCTYGGFYGALQLLRALSSFLAFRDSVVGGLGPSFGLSHTKKQFFHSCRTCKKLAIDK